VPFRSVHKEGVMILAAQARQGNLRRQSIATVHRPALIILLVEFALILVLVKRLIG
jgi:hypothetical protein